MYAWLKDDVVMAGPHVQLAQEPRPVFHYFTFNGSVKCQTPKKSPKRKPDTLVIQRRNSSEIGKSQKKTNSPKENQSPIYLTTMIGIQIA